VPTPVGMLADRVEPTVPGLVRVSVTAAAAPGPSSTAQAFPRESNTRVDTIDTYLPVSFTRGILLGGLDAPTGGQSQTNPHPVLIRLSDNSVLPNRFRAEYRECFVIAAGYGDISSERAYLRTETLSCVRDDGSTLEVKIQGSVYGEDGKVGMRGRLVTKQGQILANALLAGLASGLGQGLATASTTVSASTFGTIATSSGSQAYRAGLGNGAGRALDRLAQYYIKLAEQTFPVIEVDAGRTIDVVITKGVRIDTATTAKDRPASSLPPAPRSPEEQDLKGPTHEDY
ncbi:MAG: traB, partial [Ramlibacter sp.]|nr:traB [Ramlibacter sp.]